jgi:hypothetical protein
VFYEKGWMPLVDLYRDVRADWIKENPKPSPVETVDFDSPTSGDTPDFDVINEIGRWNHFVHVEANMETWAICDSLKIIGVTSPSGRTVHCSKMLLEWESPSSNVGWHVNLAHGTVGSARWLDEFDEPPSERDLLQTYGPFLGWPVVLKVQEVKEARIALRMNAQAALSGILLEPKGYSTSEVAKRILAAVERGETMTKSNAEALFAGPMSHGQFLLAWRKATEVRPDLAKGGRRPGT